MDHDADLALRREGLQDILTMTRKTVAGLAAREVHEVEQVLADELVLFEAAGVPVNRQTAMAFLLGVSFLVSEAGDRAHIERQPCLARHHGLALALAQSLVDRRS